MKLAVFQVSEGGAAAWLVCVPMSSLYSAADLERWFKMNAGDSREITLLGRFDSITFAGTEEEAASAIFANAQMPQLSMAGVGKLPHEFRRCFESAIRATDPAQQGN